MKKLTRHPYHERLHLARAYMDSHYDQPITLEHVSGEAGFSPYHFIRLFRSAYRQTPHQYLIQQRIEKAKQLLRSGDLPVHEICYAVGFESLGSFSTLFRRNTGLSPASYRKVTRRTTHPAFIPLCYRVKNGLD